MGLSQEIVASEAYTVAIDVGNDGFISGTTDGGLAGNTFSASGSKDFFVIKFNASGNRKERTVCKTGARGNPSMNANYLSISRMVVRALLPLATSLVLLGCGGNGAAPVIPWSGTQQLGAPGTNTDTQGYVTTTDGSGNIYIAGYTTGDLDGNTLTGTYDIFVTKYDPSGAKQWTRQLGAAGSAFAGGNTFAYGVATDSKGNVFVAGQTNTDLDGNTLSGSNHFDLFLTKYSSAGTKQWTRQLGAAEHTAGGGSQTVAMGVVVDSSGNVYVGGYTSGDLDGNTRTGSLDYFVVKYDNDGNRQWTKQRGAAGAPATPNDLAIDGKDNVYVAGVTNADLDGNTGTGGEDFFVVKFDSSGDWQWTRQLGATGTSTEGTGVATDGAGNVYVTGNTTGGLDGNTLTGSQDFFVTKYDSTGAKQWTAQLGAAGDYTTANKIGADSAGNVYVVGYTTVDLDGNTLSYAGNYDLFVTKYNTDGTKQWTRQAGVPETGNDTEAQGVATYGSNSIFMTGLTSGGLDGNTNSGTGNNDFFLMKFDSSGVKQ